MKLMFPKNSFVSTLLSFIVLSLALTGSLTAQSKKVIATKKPVTKTAAKAATRAVSQPSSIAVSKKNEKQVKDAKKDRDKAKDNKRDKLTARDKKDRDKAKLAEARDNKRDKLAAEDKKRTVSDKKDPRKSAELKKAEAERRRKEEERRQAILAEQRRREQARREAIARKIAFERGLRTETVANISNDKTDGENLQIRQAAINALGAHAGSVVVMEAQTGKVLTIVNQDWAVRSSIRPCSTIKLVTAAAALNEGVISKEDGSVKNTATRRSLDDAIAFSDNTYFQRAGAQLGNTKLVEYGKQLGLGEQTGVNLEGETAGRLPYSNNNARIYSHGDDTEVSTIQLAVMVAAITNGGKRVLPRIPRNTLEQTKFQTFYRAKVELPQQNVRRMIPGMMGAAEYGTAHRNMDQSLGVAGKTGSCIDKGSWVGLFASVAPIESPKYAVAVITRGQSERGRYAAAVAAQIYRMLATEIVRTDRNLAQTEFHIKPKYDAATAAKIADSAEEDDEADANGEISADAADLQSEGREVIVVPSAPRVTRKRLVTKTGDSKPLFPPVVITFDKDGNEIKRTPRQKPE
ncbi:MAG: penicillin-binding transpeptidase domain-containing protein [Pyrinomonadaceae bacterium]